LNTINCEGSGIRCVGTDRADLMQGTAGIDAMYGRDKGDTLKGFGKGDALLGQNGEDTLLGGGGQDFVIGGQGDDRLRGEDALDIYYFERSEWGQDTIIDAAPPGNVLRLPHRESFSGAITTSLASDSGPLPEVTNADSGSTVNWKGEVISIVIGSTGNDTANDIFDGEELDTDADTISGAGANDLLDVRDGAGDDEVACGEGNDTVYFDEGDVVVVPGDCEEQNPIGGGSGLEGLRATTYGAGVLGEAPALVVEGHRP